MEDSAKQPLKRVISPTAKRLEGLISMHQDLMYVVRVTHDALALTGDKVETDGFLLRTYWSSALIAYARPFKDGVRDQGLKLVAADIFTGIEGALESHLYFLNQRDKLIAHSVNPFEQVIAGVAIDPDGKVIDAGELAVHLIATDEQGINDLNQLAKTAIEHNKTVIEVTRADLIREASSMSSEELEQLEDVRFVAPGPDRAGEGR